MMRRFLQNRRLLVYRFDGSSPVVPPLEDGLRYVVLDQDTIDSCFGNRMEDMNRRRTYQRFVARGCVGMAIAKGEDWASVGWVSHPGSPPPPHLTRKIIGPDVLWTFYVHTREGFRGLGLQKAGLAFRIRLARSVIGDEHASVYSDVAPDNTASRRAKIHVGFVSAGQLAVTTMRIPRLGGVTIGSWDRDVEHVPLNATREPEAIGDAS